MEEEFYTTEQPQSSVCGASMFGMFVIVVICFAAFFAN